MKKEFKIGDLVRPSSIHPYRKAEEWPQKVTEGLVHYFNMLSDYFAMSDMASLVKDCQDERMEL